MFTEGIDPDSFRYALKLIKDGNIFEKFGLDFLSKVLGYQFISAGGVRDRGIDGFEHAFHRSGLARTIYQLSVEEKYKGKIDDSLNKLKKNRINCNRMVYVTNMHVESKDLLVDQLFGKYGIALEIYDRDWFANRVNESTGTIQSYHTFIE